MKVKISKKKDVQLSKRWCKWGVEVGGPALWYHGDCLRPTDRSDLCTGQQHTNVYQDLNNSKNIAFNVNKADKRGCRPDATAKGWKSDASGVRAGLTDLGH